MSFKIILWGLYSVLIILILLDIITTYIGLGDPCAEESNKLARDHFYINAGIQALILVLLGAIIYYIIVISKNLEVINGGC